MPDLTTTNVFVLEVDGQQLGSFRKVSGIENESEIIEYKEVTKDGKMIIRKSPGSQKWADITLERRVDTDKGLWEWRKQVIDGDIDKARRHGSIIAKNSKMEEVARWNFTNAWPSKWVGGDLDAGSNEVNTEKITIAHEGLERV
ncbi:phage tail protein [Actinocrispum wychmicini]|uniref:Phage tail-like protein n=1 Tax=Actinocrispum wychmicini TaxID=1213861 RepID=A0A4R2JE82_9PSEU|nr:phage tail protein [Actinocrispum wychmicini]TCO55196.1 phage tail-like protein [Actinocrispum wychmicini]